jgi:hypothetical protein
MSAKFFFVILNFPFFSQMYMPFSENRLKLPKNDVRFYNGWTFLTNVRTYVRDIYTFFWFPRENIWFHYNFATTHANSVSVWAVASVLDFQIKFLIFKSRFISNRVKNFGFPNLERFWRDSI